MVPFESNAENSTVAVSFQCTETDFGTERTGGGLCVGGFVISAHLAKSRSDTTNRQYSKPCARHLYIVESFFGICL